jgi:hypothetical protein
VETWIQFGITLITMATLFLWVRTESRADIRYMDNKLDAIRELTFAIQNEMKDFHSRLIEIEKNRGK